MACEALRVFRSGEGEEGERGLECERGKEGREKEGGRKGFYKRKRSYEKQKKKREGGAGRGREGFSKAKDRREINCNSAGKESVSNFATGSIHSIAVYHSLM